MGVGGGRGIHATEAKTRRDPRRQLLVLVLLDSMSLWVRFLFGVSVKFRVSRFRVQMGLGPGPDPSWILGFLGSGLS